MWIMSAGVSFYSRMSDEELPLNIVSSYTLHFLKLHE